MKLLTEGCECQLEQAIEAALLGLASLALTLANILCIVLTGIAILRQALAHFIYLERKKMTGGAPEVRSDKSLTLLTFCI